MTTITKRALIFLLALLSCVILLNACEHTHEFGEWSVSKPATCTEQGEQERTCSCGEKEMQSIDVVAHNEVIDKAVEPTCTMAGKTEGKHCSVCNAVIVAQTTVSAKRVLHY